MKVFLTVGGFCVAALIPFHPITFVPLTASTQVTDTTSMLVFG